MPALALLIALVVLTWHFTLVAKSNQPWKLALTTILLLAVGVLTSVGVHQILEAYRRDHLRGIAENTIVLCEFGASNEIKGGMQKLQDRLTSNTDSFNGSLSLATDLQRSVEAIRKDGNATDERADHDESLNGKRE
jgi:hypothetical protein